MEPGTDRAPRPLVVEAMRQLIRGSLFLALLLAGWGGAQARFDPPQRAASVDPADPPLTHLPAPDGDEEPRGAGGGSPATSYLLQSLTLRAARSLGYLDFPGAILSDLILEPSYLPRPSVYVQGDLDILPASDGQFVWGPNVGEFDIQSFLEGRGSPLAAYAPEIALWASYSSVNPKLLLGALEFQSGLVSSIPMGWSRDDVLAAIEDASMTMATAFYEHLHTWGERRPDLRTPESLPPLIRLKDGAVVQLDARQASGSFGVAAFVGKFTDTRGFETALTQGGAGSFEEVFAGLFPSVDLQDTSNVIDPPGTPPPDMFQMPFPLGATWTFGGPHSWNGNSTPPFSSMDFISGGGTCPAPPYLFSVSAASGAAYRPYGYSCWLEIDHGAGWTTSYYHLRNLTAAAAVDRNAALGTIACEICAGGYATGPHVHFSLKYNGAYLSLEGVELSGWTIHVGSTAYTSGSIQRDGVSLNPYSQVLNDYHTRFGTGLNTSLRFYGGASNTAGRVALPVDEPSNTRRGPPVDVGSSDDFMVDLWIRANSGDNAAAPITCGGNPNWIQGNIVLDRRRTAGAGYGVSLAGGRVAFGVTGPALDSLTLCGTSDIGDGEWHLITIARNRWDGVAPDGFLWLFVDGRLEASGPGPQGDISYPDSAPAVSPADPFLVLGADKYDAGLPFLGWLDELRFTNILRTRVDFPAPTSPYLNDINTAALFHFDEGAGDIAYDTSGFGGGPSSARRTTAGSPPGPEWSVENPFAAWEGTATPSPTPSPTATVTGTLSATPTPSATATPTRTTSPSPTATASLTLTPTPSASPTTTADPSATASSIPTSTTPTSTTTSTSAPTVTSIPSATPGGSALPGDLSLDGLVNVVDLQLCVNVVLGSETDAGIVGRADMNNDSVANVLDIQAIVNLIMIG